MRSSRYARWLMTAALLTACGNDPAPTAPTSPTGPTTETFSSNLVVQGSAWRLVSASQAGTLVATLTSVTQPSVLVGLGVGIHSGTGTGCLLNSAVTVQAGSAPQIAMPVDAGIYCIKIFDVGSLADPMGFTITIVRP